MKISSDELTLDFLESVGKEEVIISHKGEDFYFKFHIKEHSNRLAIHTNGAVNYEVKRPPVYQRSSWGRLIDAHCIFIDDRTLHNTSDELFNTAWLIGTQDRHYVKDYSEIIKLIQDILNIETKNIYYWGSSAGGTASIALATLHKGTTAIANNPQTNILTDYPRRRDAIFRNVFSNLSKEEVIENYYDRLTLAALIKRESYVPRIFYIQNNNHEPDLKRHFQKFFDELNEYSMDKSNITIWFYHDLERGHGPLDLDTSLEYLHSIMSFKFL